MELSTPHELAEFACASSAAADELVDELNWLEQWVEPARKLQDECLRAIAVYERPGAESSVDYTDYRNRTAGRSYARRVWQDAVAQRRLMMLGSSNLVRDLDAAAPALGSPPRACFANRGLAGIDGTIATAIGVSLSGYYPAGVDENSRPIIGGAALPVTLLCGDLTFQHDVSSLNLPNTELLPELRVEVLMMPAAVFSRPLNTVIWLVRSSSLPLWIVSSQWLPPRTLIWRAWLPVLGPNRVLRCAFTP